MTALFRSAALRARRAKAAGDIVLAAPVSHALLAAWALAVAAAIVSFLVLGTYTRHATLAGQLLPRSGVIELRAPQSGTILRKLVAEDGRVERGDVLFVISGERSSALGATHALIGDQLAARRRSLNEQIEEMRLLEQADRESLEKRIGALDAELLRLERMAADQSERVVLAEQTAQRYERLHAEGFVSEEQLVARRESVLDQRTRRSGLERERAQLARQLTDLGSELANLALRYKHQAAELERAITGIDLEVTENEARRQAAVIAPAAGIASAVSAEVGQAVETGRPLVSILPLGARLYAELKAPSRAIGFVEAGADVLLRYPAYPYQKFGHHSGKVLAVSRAALPAVEAGFGGGSSGSEPLYRVIVEIESQSVDVYGKARPLRAGMLVEADVKLETRRLYEWVLEPLYALRTRASGSGPP